MKQSGFFQGERVTAKERRAAAAQSVGSSRNLADLLRHLPKPFYRDDSCALYCGDARTLLPKLSAGSVDMMFTDPPYGHNNNDGDLAQSGEAALGRRGNPATTTGTARPIANDGVEANELAAWLFKEASRLLVPGGCCCCCCCGGGGPDPQFARWSLMLDAILPFKMCVVWDKGGLGLGWHYRRGWECVLVGQQPGAACKWYGGNAVANIVRFPKIIPSAKQHPTEKPVALPAFFIRMHSRPGEIVLDPFAGGGSTLVAAKQLGRFVIGIELEERWCAMAAAKLRQRVLMVSD